MNLASGFVAKTFRAHHADCKDLKSKILKLGPLTCSKAASVLNQSIIYSSPKALGLPDHSPYKPKIVQQNKLIKKQGTLLGLFLFKNAFWQSSVVFKSCWCDFSLGLGLNYSSSHLLVHQHPGLIHCPIISLQLAQGIFKRQSSKQITTNWIASGDTVAGV